MYLFCDLLDGSLKHHVACIYWCKEKDKTVCASYAKRYEELQVEYIEPKYEEKYGKAVFPLPESMRKKAEQLSKKEKEKEKRDKEFAALQKKKDKDKRKKQKALEIEQKKLEKQKKKQEKQNKFKAKLNAKIAEINAPVVKKRVRRTKAQMQAANLNTNTFFE